MDVRLVEVGLGIVFVLAVVGQAVAIADSWGGGYWWFDAVAGALVCSAALMRRRAWAAPTAVAVAGIAVVVARVVHLPSEPGPAMVLGLSVIVGAAAHTLPTRSAVTVVGAVAVVVAGGWLVSPVDADGVAPVTAISVAGWLAALATGLCLRLRDVRRQAVTDVVRRDERLELARELHDVVAHHITGVVLQAQAARVVRRKHPERLDDSLAGIEAASADALAAMRRVVGLLRDNDDVVSVAAGTEPLGKLVSRFTGPAVRLRLPDGETRWPPEVASTVYRVVQESLTNVARHAPRARAVSVTVGQDGRGVTVEVANDAAAGPAQHHRRGYGLVGMRERVEALGGTLYAGPGENADWVVRAVVPV